MSSKLPYYPYYVDDFDGDANVLAMNLAEVGLYQLALNEAWRQGSIPADPKELARLIRRKPAEVCRAWPKVQPCWIPNCLPGRLVNPRQERERVIAEGRSTVRSTAAKTRWGSSSEDPCNSICKSNAIASESGSASISPSLSSSENSSRVRVLLDDFIRRWARHRGFKKPNKAMQVRVEQRWGRIDIADAELDAAMDGFFDSEWGKHEHFPILGFLKDPHSWIADEVRPPVVPIVETEGWDSGPAPAAVPLRDFVAEWNAVVKAKPIEWNTTLSPTKNLSDCASSLEFCNRFAEVCELAQKAHERRGAEVNYINFAWIIKQKDGVYGWWRLLTDLRDVSDPPQARVSEARRLLDQA